MARRDKARSFDRPEDTGVHICVLCRHRRSDCVERVEGMDTHGRWVCRECLEAAGQMRLEEMYGQ